MTRKKSSLWIFFVLLVMVILSACQKSTAPSTNAGTAPNNAGTPTAIKIDMNEYNYSPKEIKVKSGAKIHFVLTNSGKVPHDINNDALNLDKDVDPGKTEEYDWTAPTKLGTYPIICDKPGHKEAGMTMNLIVD